GHALDAELCGQPVDRGLREVKRTIAPEPAPAHPGRVRLVRIEHEERGAVSFLHAAAAPDDGATLLGDRNDKSLMSVRRILVGREIRAHEAEATGVAVPPVLGGVPRIDPRHRSAAAVPRNFRQYPGAHYSQSEPRLKIGGDFA